MQKSTHSSYGFNFHVRSETHGDVDVIDKVVCHDVYRLRQLKAMGLEPSVVLDIGAHIGSFSVLAHSLWPDASIYAVEPNPESYELLCQNAPFAQCLQAALRYDGANLLTESDGATGVGFITTAEEFEAAAEIKHSQDGFTYRIAIENVRLVTVEDIFEQFGIQGVDLLKLNCEASEVNFLQNLTASMARKFRFVLGEYHATKGFAWFKTLAERALPHLEIYGGNDRQLGPFWSKPRVTRRFKHSGDIGDLLYALPTIRALGGGTLALCHSDFTRQPMSPATAEALTPLLLLQPYIEGVELYEPDLPLSYDLDQFRAFWKAHGHYGNTIANYHLSTFGLDSDEVNVPWLKVDFAMPLEKYPVIFHRSPRHQNHRFPWRRIVDRYRGQATFVGLAEEHQAFCAAFGEVPYYPTADFLELARLIAGCRLYVGNQSAPYAVAEGLKVNSIQEVFPGDPNCLFPRTNALYVWNQTVSLPPV